MSVVGLVVSLELAAALSLIIAVVFIAGAVILAAAGMGLVALGPAGLGAGAIGARLGIGRDIGSGRT